MTTSVEECMKKVETLEQHMKDMQAVQKKGDRKQKKNDKPRESRPKTAYQTFMSERILQLKKDNNELSHKDAFKGAVEAWNKEKEKKTKT